MTVEELVNLREILLWAEGKVMSESMHKKLENARFVVQRDIKLKTYDFQKDRPILDLDVLTRINNREIKE